MLLSTLFALAIATPEIKFPFNNQLPPVARYGQPYSYQLNPNTFSSSETITLSCADLPSWLSFDASSNTFSGSAPSDSSAGDQTLDFTIIAADSTGTIAADCKLSLVSSSVPKTTESLVEVLRAAGPTSDSSSLVLSPGENFEFDFPSGYFSSDGRSVIGHYSVTREHAPLPIWLNFDGSARKFWGTAPTVASEIAKAEVFEIVYIESTVQGFATASSQFNLLVGAHSFSTSLTTETLNVTEGEFFSYQIPFHEIQLNDHDITAANVSNVNVQGLPSWLTWASDNYTISGTPNKDVANQTFSMTVDVNDLYNDSIQFSLEIAVQAIQSTTVFKSSSIGPVNVTQGQFFSYSLKSALVSEDVDISITTDQDWVSYQASNFSLQGQAPSSFNTTTITLNAQANNKKRDTGTSATITLLGVRRETTSSSTSSSSIASSSSVTRSATSAITGTSSATATDAATATTAATVKSNSKKIALICGLTIPLGLLLLLALILLFLFCRRRRQKARGSSSPRSTLADKAVSAPVLVKSDQSPAFFNRPPSIHTGGDEGTMVGTPEVEKEDTKDWTTPQRVSAFNFLKMDGSNKTSPSTDASKAAALDGSVDIHAIKNASVDATGDAGTAAAVIAADQSKYANIPRASWRHTNTTERRWQDNRVSYNSLASVADGTEQLYPAGGGRHLPRDGSSGIVHAMGSDFSSREHSMQFNTLHEEDSASSHYQTASSGDEDEDAPFEGDSSPEIQTFKNQNGSFEFRQGDNPRRTQKAQLRNSEFVTGKPKTVGHQPHNSQSGELAFI